MAHEKWCGKPCGECLDPCKLDQEMPCSPDCEALNYYGTRNITKCKVCECDAVIAPENEYPEYGNTKYNERSHNMTVLMEINTWANRCGYFYNAYLTPKDSGDTEFYPGRDPSPNNGYNCRHPDCDCMEDGVGCCYTWSCPFGFEADEEDCKAYGVEHQESEFIIVDIPETEFNDNRMWKRLQSMKRYRMSGHTTVNVVTVVEADSPKKALEKANDELCSLHDYASNGGTDKLVGVCGENDSVSVDEGIIWDGYEELDPKNEKEYSDE